MKANGTKRKIFNDAVNLLNGAGDMVESIREYGILNPVIVWQNSDGYEMLAGHNRQNAGKLAKQAKIKLDANTAKCLKGYGRRCDGPVKEYGTLLVYPQSGASGGGCLRYFP